ncbi:MAG: hypothetical protein AB7Q04_13005 [Steroidobacteraceae bacterium]
MEKKLCRCPCHVLVFMHMQPCCGQDTEFDTPNEQDLKEMANDEELFRPFRKPTTDGK